jgi:hypothetical protein
VTGVCGKCGVLAGCVVMPALVAGIHVFACHVS